MPVEIIPLKEEDIPGAVECIQVAFADDPYFSFVFSDPSKFNKKRNVASLTARCIWGINNAMFYVAKRTDDPVTMNGDAGSTGSAEDVKQPPASTSKVVGVSMWMPPHPPSEPESWYSYYQSWVLSFRQLINNIRFCGRGGLSLKRYHIWKASQQESQDRVWTDSQGYYFCNIVAVSPEAQGMGVGRNLFKIVTDMADREGKMCYLESSKGEPNVKIYEKMGFKVVDMVNCVDGDVKCKLYGMIREPKTS